jgi:hypothetical protein
LGLDELTRVERFVPAPPAEARTFEIRPVVEKSAAVIAPDALDLKRARPAQSPLKRPPRAK